MIHLDVKAAECHITDNNTITITTKEIDNDIKVFGMQVNETIEQAQVLSATSIADGYSMPLYQNGTTLLSYKFCLGKEIDGKRSIIGDYFYITNPEYLSKTPPERKDHGIKGLLPSTMNATEYNELGIKQLMFNLEVGTIMSSSSNSKTITFYMDGNPYYFKTDILATYDKFIKWCYDNNFQLSLTLLNTKTSKAVNLIHPDAWDGTDCPTYAFNTQTQNGVGALKAAASFLAKRYSSPEYGVVDNWVIGNQVNCRTEWYYLKSTDLDVNVKEYIKAFRIIYNEIKAVNKNADIYISLDQEWNQKSNPGCFLSREYLSRFAYWMNKEGNIDYSVSIHPYNAPLYDPYAFLPQEQYVWETEDSPYLTMANIGLFIDEMSKPKYLNPNGEIRHLMISEVGYSSDISEEAQAASIAYAYSKALQYPEIKGFVLFRESDNEAEVDMGLANGLKTIDGTRKLAFEYYKTAGTAAWTQYDKQYESIVGTSLQNSLTNFQTRNEWELKED